MLCLATEPKTVNSSTRLSTEQKVSDTETKLAEWAKKQGIRFDLAKTQMIAGDIEAAAEQLKFAREHKAPEESACVVFWMRILEKRAAAMQVSA